MSYRDEDVARVVKGFTPAPPPPASLTVRFDGNAVRAEAQFGTGLSRQTLPAPVSDELRAALTATLAAAQADITERSTREQLTRYLSEEVAKLPRVNPDEPVDPETLRGQPR